MKRVLTSMLLFVLVVLPFKVDAEQLSDRYGDTYTKIGGYGELTNLVAHHYKKGIFETNYAVTLHVDDASELTSSEINDAFQEWIDGFYMAFQTSGELIGGYPAEYTTYYIDKEQDGDNITYMNIFELNVDVPYEEVEKTWAFEDEVAAKIRQVAKTDLDKVLHVTDFVQRHYGYSYDTTTTPHSHVAFLTDGFGVCQAYALMTGELLERLGMDVHYVLGYITHEDGTVEQHAWNLVKMDGKWVNVDTTWSDPFQPTKGAASYNYMMSDSLISFDHEREANNLPQANETKYEVLASYMTMTHDERYIYAESPIGTVERFLKATMERVDMPVEIAGTNLYMNDIYLYFIDAETAALKRWNVVTNEVNYLLPNVSSFYAENNRIVYERDFEFVQTNIQLEDPLAPSYKRLAFYWEEQMHELAGDLLPVTWLNLRMKHLASQHYQP